MEAVARFFPVSLDRFMVDCIGELEDPSSRIDEKTIDNIQQAYKSIVLPQRGTKGSAGYDIRSPFGFTLAPGETKKFPTGLRCRINPGWVLMVFPRSSVGFKYHVALNNTVGIIDSDYFYADNEGHIWCKIHNFGDKDMVVEPNDRICQGIFVPFGVTSDDEVTILRSGGIGSTGT